MGIKRVRQVILMLLTVGAFFFNNVCPALAVDLEDVQQRGVLRHLGITYAHFVCATSNGPAGLDVELMQRFAQHLGVRYQWVPTSWSSVFADLNGKHLNEGNKERKEFLSRGDIIANGLTILPQRQDLVDFSIPTFPTGVWLIARADSTLQPIKPSGNINTDIENVKQLLKGRSVLSMKETCLDSNLYGLDKYSTDIRFYTASENLDEMAIALLDGAAEATLLDIPDALIALQKWPGDIKVIGPISKQQSMGVAFNKSSPRLLAEINAFFLQLWKDGTYKQLVEKYYPTVFLYLGEFFKN